MIPLLAFPGLAHRRVQSPPAFKRYQSYKPYVRREYQGSCVYCRMPDGPAGSDSFHLDHYRPKRHFPTERTNYHNLFYSCAHCNRNKGHFWPTREEKANEKEVVNPDAFVMKEHLRYAGATVVPRSRRGEWTCELLDINSPARVAHREALTAVYERYVEQYDSDLENLAEVGRRITATTSTKARAELELLRSEKEAELREGYRHLVEFFGVTP